MLRSTVFAAAACLVFAAGCGDDTGDSSNGGSGGTGGTGGLGGEAGHGGEGGPGGTGGPTDGAFCGDGVVNAPFEQCDGAQLPGCTDLGFASGTTACTGGCVLDTSACVPHPEDCSDPGDEDRDGFADCLDTDCAGHAACASCGDGVATGVEACDGSVPAGTTCESLGFDAGTVTCGAGCTIDTSACVCWACGNDVLEGEEACDGGVPEGTTCESLGFDDGTVTCGEGCALDTSACVSWTCGNEVVEGSEACDGSVPEGTTCESLGFDAGTVACGEGCAFDTTACVNWVCGNGVVEGDEACDDGDTDGGDGCSATCTVETGWICDTTSCREVVCGDGTVEPGVEECDDGNTLGGDGCNASCGLEGQSCAHAFDLNTTFDATANAWTWHSTIGYIADKFQGDCATATSGGDMVASFTAPSAGRYAVRVESHADPMLYVWEGGCGTGSNELVCKNDWGTDSPRGFEFAELELQANDSIFIVVDYARHDDFGQFWLTVTPIACGDGRLTGDEQCDDGGTTAGDGCSATCTLENAREVEPNDTAPFATPLTNGVGQGSIVPLTEVDFWSVELASATTYTFHTSRWPSGLCGQRIDEDTEIVIFDGNGTQVADNDDESVHAYCSTLAFTPNASGTYYVAVRSGPWSGSEIPNYYLTVTPVPGTPAAP